MRRSLGSTIRAAPPEEVATSQLLLLDSCPGHALGRGFGASDIGYRMLSRDLGGRQSSFLKMGVEVGAGRRPSTFQGKRAKTLVLTRKSSLEVGLGEGVRHY
jgi:hypothetical protein